MQDYNEKKQAVEFSHRRAASGFRMKSVCFARKQHPESVFSTVLSFHSEQAEGVH